MIHVLHNKLNPNEVYALIRMMELTNYPYWKIHDISKEDIELPELDENGNFTEKAILVFDETKAKSAFEKRLDEIFNAKDVIKSFTNMVRIDRPATFKPKENGAAEVWNKVKTLCNVKMQKINRADLPDTINKNFKDMLDTLSDGSCFIFSDSQGRKLEVRPDGVPASMNPSLTYSELLVIVAFKYVMNFNHMEIISS